MKSKSFIFSIILSILAIILSIIAIATPSASCTHNTDKSQWRSIYRYNDASGTLPLDYNYVSEYRVDQYSVQYMYIKFEGDTVYVNRITFDGEERLTTHRRYLITYVDYLEY